jgi:hypothetical protein
MIRLKGFMFITLIFITFLSRGYGQSIVSPAPEHFNKFTDMNNIWNAADATISIELPNNKTLWLFGDTFAGPRTGDFSMEPSEVKMIRNSAIIEGEEMSFMFSGTENNPESWIPDRDTSFFWPEHAVLEVDTLRIFAVEVFSADNGNPGFNFEVGATHIASFTYPEMEHVSTHPIPSLTDSSMRFGTQILKEDDYTYIFGKKDTTENNWTWPLPYLARTEGSVTGSWEFFAGNDQWSENSDEAVPVGDRPVSETFSVIKNDQAYYMLTHEIWLVPELYILKSQSLTGPWNRTATGGIEKKFAVLESEPDNFTYNLFAHPQFEEDGKILFSVNVNTSDFSSIFDDTRNYRARFYCTSLEEAINVEEPDTLNIHNDFDNTLSLADRMRDTEDFFSYNNRFHSISIKNYEGILYLVDLNGRIQIKKEVNSGQRINIKHLPDQMYIVVFVSNHKKQISKILKH